MSLRDYKHIKHEEGDLVFIMSFNIIYMLSHIKKIFKYLSNESCTPLITSFYPYPP